MISTHRPMLVRSSALLALGLLLGSPALTWSQSIVATVPVAGSAAAVNTVTNKIYVVGGGVTVIDGTTHTPTTLQTPAGSEPNSAAVNEVTNKIYITTRFAGVLVLDGATNATATVVDPNAYDPVAVAMNPVTNKVYICNYGDDDNGNFHGSNVTVIDGNTNAVITVTDPNASGQPCDSIAVNTVTNKIYVMNNSSVTVIDGATNATTTIMNPNGSNVAISGAIIAVNPTTNRIYVVNRTGITVIDGATNALTTVTDPTASQINPVGVAVNSATDKIYVTYGGDESGITVIDGASNSTVTVPAPNAGGTVMAAVNQNTNTVYAANLGLGSVSYDDNPASLTVIDGTTHATRTIIDPHANTALAVVVNPVTNQIYVLNGNSLNPQSNVPNVTIIDGNVAPTSHTLGVVVLLGAGNITSTPAGINCAGIGACSSSAASFASGTVVHLNVANPGFEFSWGGACTGSGPCDITMDSDLFVTANFNLSGTVGSGPSGANGGGSGGGGGGIEVLTLGALLSSLIARLRRARKTEIREALARAVA
jgi:DNA-binding beta-propeller fold protein YncE